MPMTEQKTLSGHVGLWTTCDSITAFWAFIHTEPRCWGAGRSPVVSTLAEDLSGEEGTMAKRLLTFTTLAGATDVRRKPWDDR